MKTVFISETLAAPAEMPYRMMKDLFHAGHHPINPSLHDDGLIEYEGGAACVGITPHGEMLLLSAGDIDEMKLEHRFKTPAGAFVSVSEEDLRAVPARERIVGHDILRNGNIYLGQFIAERKLKSGETNYNHILGIAAWAPTPQQLIHDILQKFSQYRRQDLLDSGILMHHGPLVWTSKEMVYAARPKTIKGVDGEKMPLKNEKGEQLYTLYTLTAPRKGWNAARMYHEVFTPEDRKNVSPLARPFLRMLYNCVSTARRDMTMPEIKSYIDETFSPTVKQLRKGLSPYMLENGYGKEARPGTLTWIKGKLKQFFATAAFGLHGISKIDLLAGVVLPTAIALGVPALVEHEELAVLAAVPAAIFLSRFGFLWFSRSRPIFESSPFANLIHRFWPENTSRKNIPQQFEMVRPDVLKDLRIPPHREIDTLLRSPANKAGAAPPWDMLYLIGTLNGPYGTQASTYKIGNQWVIRTDEDAKTSGLNVEYWPLLNVAFAKNPQSDRLPQSLLQGFRDAGKPIRMIYARRDQTGSISGYNSAYLTQTEYDRTVKKLQKKEANDIYHPSEKTGELLTDYPLPSIADEENNHETSEWATDSKAATGAEVLAEIAKALLKGPH